MNKEIDRLTRQLIGEIRAVGPQAGLIKAYLGRAYCAGQEDSAQLSREIIGHLRDKWPDAWADVIAIYGFEGVRLGHTEYGDNDAAVRDGYDLDAICMCPRSVPLRDCQGCLADARDEV